MYILLIINFLFSCCIGVFLYNQLKEREDEIEELYNLFYDFINSEQNKKKNIRKDKVMYFGRNDF